MILYNRSIHTHMTFELLKNHVTRLTIVLPFPLGSNQEDENLLNFFLCGQT